ncbi:MAG: hypothetical protein LBD52_08255 [Prevotellaceae bacterium]|jgi:hypothetical protein|nr:hypothetical protein [Prevotellaceae bacterium]
MKTLCVFFLSAIPLFLSCNNESEPQDTPLPEKITANITYELSGGENITDLFGINVTWTDATGSQAQETVTVLPWEKTVSVDSIPFTATMSVTYSGKSDYPDKSAYKVGMGGGISYRTSAGNFGSASVASTITVSNDRIAAYIQEKAKTVEYSTEIK